MYDVAVSLLAMNSLRCSAESMLAPIRPTPVRRDDASARADDDAVGVGDEDRRRHLQTAQRPTASPSTIRLPKICDALPLTSTFSTAGAPPTVDAEDQRRARTKVEAGRVDVRRAAGDAPVQHDLADDVDARAVGQAGDVERPADDGRAIDPDAGSA